MTIANELLAVAALAGVSPDRVSVFVSANGGWQNVFWRAAVEGTEQVLFVANVPKDRILLITELEVDSVPLDSSLVRSFADRKAGFYYNDQTAGFATRMYSRVNSKPYSSQRAPSEFLGKTFLLFPANSSVEIAVNTYVNVGAVTYRTDVLMTARGFLLPDETLVRQRLFPSAVKFVE